MAREVASMKAQKSQAQERHVPVLLQEMLVALNPGPEKHFIDGTFGAGGYSRALLEASPDCRVLGIDRDPDAVEAGAAVVAEFSGRLTLIEGRFGDLAEIATENGFDPADGVVLDIGVSSMQIDEAERGFSFRFDGPLDMRMERKGPSAADLVNTLEEAEIADILWRYGEERRSRAIARAIVKARAVEPITTTGALAKLVASVVWVQGDAINPATRTFQALRIAVNDELGELERGLEAAEAVLAPGGRLAVVTFHSLEDRIVKDFMTERSGRTAAPSRHLPQTQQERARFSLVTRKPITAGDAEIRLNPRARSAKLRVVERVADHAIPELAGGY